MNTLPNYKQENLVIENAHIMFRNFAGRETKFNRAGSRNFCVEIDDPAIAGALMEDGWNVRTLAPRNEEDEDERFYIQVNVSFRNIPPKVILVTRKNRTALSEATIETLDNADIRTVDLVIRPYNWELGGRTGVKGYVKTMYVVLEEDEFGDKYAEPDEGVGEEADLPF